MGLTDKNRPFHPVTLEYIFFLSLHGIFSRVERVLGHRTSFNKLKIFKSYPLYLLTTMEQS